jgi:hypothetical protein
MTVRESLGRVFRRNARPRIDPEQTPPFAAICWLAPVVVLSLPLLLANTMALAAWIKGIAGAGEAFGGFLTIGFLPLLLGLPIAWAGMFAFGYPVLKLLWKRRISSYIVHALAGGATGGATMMIVVLVIAASERGKVPDTYQAYVASAVFGACLGLVTALLGRWAMTWRWLRS